MIPYNFYIYMILFCVISAIVHFIIKDVLKKCALPHYLLATQIVLSIIFIVWYLFFTKYSFSDCIQQFKTNKTLLFQIIGIAFLIFFIVLLGDTVLQRESVLRHSLWRQIGQITTITFLTYLLVKRELTLAKLFGIVIILGGLYIVETS